LRVIHAISGTNIDPELPYAIPAEPVIAEVPLLHAVDAFDDLHLSDGVSNLLDPLKEEVFAVL
jgi:hypothetical protein